LPAWIFEAVAFHLPAGLGLPHRPLDPVDETCREHEGVVVSKYLWIEPISEAIEFSTKHFHCQSGLAEGIIRKVQEWKKRHQASARKLTRAVQDLQNLKDTKNRNN
jgi:hypothetical protein